MSKINTLEELLLDELHDLHSAETQLVKALPKMAEAASNPELKAGFAAHLEQTKGHVERLERAFQILNVKASGKTCDAMEGLIDEGEEAVKLKGPVAIRDADLIGAAQRVEHYEIAAYGTARAFAQKLRQNEIASLLEETLHEESETNEKLTTLSERVNDDALACGQTA